MKNGTRAIYPGRNKTLGSIGKMNAALQQQLDLAFIVSIAVTADQEAERIIVTNLTKTAIYVWAAKFDGEPPLKLPDERFIGPSVSYFFKFEKLFDKARVTTPKGSPAHQVPLDFYLLSADGKPWVARGFLSEVWEGDALKIYPSTISVKQEAWPAGVK